MSDSTSDSSGTLPESAETTKGAPVDNRPVTNADILGEQSSSTELLADVIPSGMPAVSGTDAIQDHSDLASVGVIRDLALADGVDGLNINDVLSGLDVTNGNLGAYLTVQTAGGNTVISVDADGLGSAYNPVTVVTVEGVTGLTLQQLLNSIDS